jgi:hypothetical protein
MFIVVFHSHFKHILRQYLENGTSPLPVPSIFMPKPRWLRDIRGWKSFMEREQFRSIGTPFYKKKISAAGV